MLVACLAMVIVLAVAGWFVVREHQRGAPTAPQALGNLQAVLQSGGKGDLNRVLLTDTPQWQVDSLWSGYGNGKFVVHEVVFGHTASGAIIGVDLKGDRHGAAVDLHVWLREKQDGRWYIGIAGP